MNTHIHTAAVAVALLLLYYTSRGIRGYQNTTSPGTTQTQIVHRMSPTAVVDVFFSTAATAESAARACVCYKRRVHAVSLGKHRRYITAFMYDISVQGVVYEVFRMSHTPSLLLVCVPPPPLPRRPP